MQPSDNQQSPLPQNQGFYRPTEPAQYQDENLGADSPPAPEYDENETVSWEASEYIHRHKDTKWLVIYIMVAVAVFGAAIWFQEWIFAGLVVVMAGAMGYFAFRPPHTKHYTLSHHTLKVDDKMYNLSDFRAFGIIAEDAFYSAMLLPTGRFRPALTMYFAEDEGKKIVDILGAHLAIEELAPDPLDMIMRRLHF